MNYAIKATKTVFFEFDSRTSLFKVDNESVSALSEKNILSIMDYENILHPDDKEKLLSCVKQMQQGINKSIAVDIRQKDDNDPQWHYCCITFTPFERDVNGNIIRYVGLRRDNTQTIRYQKSLEEYKVKIEMAMEISNIFFWDYDCSNKSFNISGKFKYPHNNTFSINEYFTRIHPNNLSKFKHFFNDLKNGQNSSITIDDFQYHNPNSKVWEHGSIGVKPFILDKNGKCIRYIGYQLNTTKWHQLNVTLNTSNQLLNEIIDKLPCSLRIKDVNDDFRYIVVNKKTMEYFGVKRDQILGKRSCDFRSEKEDQRVHELDMNAIRNGSYTYRDVFKVNGEDLVFQTTKFYMETIDGRNLLISISLNITSLDKTLKELQIEKEKAQQADILKSAFLANMSHEIRTPLNAIIGFSNLLQTAFEPQEKEEYINIINQNNDLLLRLINDILDLSKIEAGLIELTPEKFDLSVSFNELFFSMKQRANNPDVIFSQNNPYKRCVVNIDRNRFIQVESNFITNAIKHTEHGFITMGYEIVDNGIRIYVKDSGPGIPQDKQELIFERFEKLNHMKQGTGLGLAICAAIVNAFGGKIGVNSQEGQGSEFWAWIPTTVEIES